MCDVRGALVFGSYPQKRRTGFDETVAFGLPGLVTQLA
jgi:hypothetical protein